VGHVDDQGISLPVPARISHPQLDVASNVRTGIQRNDARAVVELLKEHHVAGQLKYLKFTLIEDAGYTTQITKRVRVDVLRFGQGQVVVLNLFPLCRSPGLIRKLA